MPTIHTYRGVYGSSCTTTTTTRLYPACYPHHNNTNNQAYTHHTSPQPRGIRKAAHQPAIHYVQARLPIPNPTPSNVQNLDTNDQHPFYTTAPHAFPSTMTPLALC